MQGTLYSHNLALLIDTISQDNNKVMVYVITYIYNLMACTFEKPIQVVNSLKKFQVISGDESE